MSFSKFFLIIIFPIFLFSFSSNANDFNKFSIYLTDVEKFDLWGNYNRGENAVKPESPDELKYNHTCLFLSIDEEKLDTKKNAYLRYKKVNKSKLAQSVEYLKSKSFDMTNCSLD
jgi:hypothetical protein